MAGLPRIVTIATLAVLATPAAATASHQDLAGRWSLDSATAEGVTDDGSGHGNTGELRYGASLTADGRFGNAVDPSETQSGSSGVYIDPSDPAALEPLTISLLAWVKQSGNPGDYKFIAAKGADACLGSSFSLSTAPGGGVRFGIRNGANQYSPQSNNGIWDGQWHALVGTYDGSVVRLFVDGSQVGSGTAAPGSVDYALDDRQLTVGSYPNSPVCGGFPYAFPGLIDEPTVFARALTQEEITWLSRRDATTPPGLPPPGGTPPPPPPRPPAPPVSLERPSIVPAQSRSRRVARTWRCRPGRWTGIAPGAEATAFGYAWTRLDRSGNRRTVATTPTYSPAAGPLTAALNDGAIYACLVRARNGGGATIARSRAVLLVPTFPAPIRLQNGYGNFRVRGIDVFQVVQPNSGAQKGVYPSGAFASFPGGGTPTGLTPFPGGIGCQAVGGERQRAAYDGVSLDPWKPAIAAVYVDVANARPADTSAGVDVSLALMDGERVVRGPLVRQVRQPATSFCPTVSAAERADPRFSARFAIPAEWLVMQRLAGRRMDLRATVGFPPLTRRFGLRQCDEPGCEGDDQFRLDDVRIGSFLPGLTVQTIQLANGTQTLKAPEFVLRDVRRLFPGGESLDVLPYGARLDISGATTLQAGTKACGKLDTRSCRSAGLKAAIASWLLENPGRYRLFGKRVVRYDALVAVHSYQSAPGSTEPGWTASGLGSLPGIYDVTEAGGSPTLGGVLQPYSAVTDSTRPLTAAAHELGHFLGAPHAGGVAPFDGSGPRSPGCGGNSDRQIGEPWAPDNNGRLQGTAYDPRGPSRAGQGRVTADGLDTTALYDLMSYCASEADAWVSPFNWGRWYSALEQYGVRRDSELSAPTASATASAAQRGRGGAYAVGTVTADGGSITSVGLLDPGDLSPPAVSSSGLRLRSLGRAGELLLDAGVVPQRTTDGAASAVFVGPVARGAAAVELVRAGAPLDRVERSASPTVTLRTPRGGVRVRGGRALTVRWRSRDRDTVARQAAVDYSADGGRSWRTLVQGPDRGRATLPARVLSRARRARVRVSINDGFNEVSVVSKPFRADGLEPAVTIVRPAGGEPVQAGRVTLLGAARDDRGRPLAGRALTWFAGRRRLGRGRKLTIKRIAPGRATLRLVARDGAGRRATVRRRVRIVTGPPRLLRLEAPSFVKSGARRIRLRVRGTGSDALRIGGRRYRIGRRTRRLRVALPASPRRGLLRLRFTLRGAGGSARGSIELVRG